MAQLIGKVIKTYVLKEQVGLGGMGTVYRAHDLNLDRLVAIKIMHSQYATRSSFRERFLREAKAMSKLQDHPSIIPVYEFGEEDGSLFMVTEYVSTGSLAQYMKRLQKHDRRLPLREILRLLAQIAEALQYAHRRGVIHRDIKPDNILIKELERPDRAGDIALRAVVMDFGLAKLLTGDQLTRTATFMGTLAYMSPEMALGDPVDHRSDLYSVGVILFQLATGELPFKVSSPTDIVVKHLRETVPTAQSLHPGIPNAVAQIIDKSLAKDAGERFQSGDEFAKQLRDVASSLTDEDVAGFAPIESLSSLVEQVKSRPPLNAVSDVIAAAREGELSEALAAEEAAVSAEISSNANTPDLLDALAEPTPTDPSRAVRSTKTMDAKGMEAFEPLADSTGAPLESNAEGELAALVGSLKSKLTQNQSQPPEPPLEAQPVKDDAPKAHDSADTKKAAPKQGGKKSVRKTQVMGAAEMSAYIEQHNSQIVERATAGQSPSTEVAEPQAKKRSAQKPKASSALPLVSEDDFADIARFAEKEKQKAQAKVKESHIVAPSDVVENAEEVRASAGRKSEQAVNYTILDHGGADEPPLAAASKPKRTPPRVAKPRPPRNQTIMEPVDSPPPVRRNPPLSAEKSAEWERIQASRRESHIPDETRKRQVANDQSYFIEGGRQGGEVERVGIGLKPSHVRLSPGELAQIQVSIANQTQKNARYAIRAKCEHPTVQTNLSQDVIDLRPGQTAQITMTMRAPKGSKATAGQYSWRVNVGSFRTKKKIGSASGQIEIEPFEQHRVELRPSNVRHNNDCQVAIYNEGNAPVRYRISGRDPAALVNFDIESPQIDIDPGDVKMVKVRLSAEERPYYGKTEKKSFEIRVGTGAGQTNTQRGNLLVQPKIPYWAMGLGVFGLIVILFFTLATIGNGFQRLPVRQIQTLCRVIPRSISGRFLEACRLVRTGNQLAVGLDSPGGSNQFGTGTTAGPQEGGDAPQAVPSTIPLFDSAGNQIVFDASGNPIRTNPEDTTIAVDASGNPIAFDASGSPIAVDGAGNPIAVNAAGSPLSAITSGSDTPAQGTEPVAVAQEAVVGQSPQGTELGLIKIGSGPNGVLLVGGIHAGYAPSSVALANEVIGYFTANPAEVPDSVTLFVMPNMNPDATPAVKDISGRFNSNGVDLNRNFDCDWKADATVLRNSIPGSGGSAPLSEPESIAFQKVITEFAPRAVIVVGAAAPNGSATAGQCGATSQVSGGLVATYATAAGIPIAGAGTVTGDVTDWLDKNSTPAIFILLKDHADVSADIQPTIAGLKAVMASQGE